MREGRRKRRRKKDSLKTSKKKTSTKQLSTGNCPFAARNSEGLTALEVARLNGREEVAEMLIGFGG